MKRISLAAALLIFTSFAGYAQQAPCERVADVKTTSAYTMLTLRKTAIEAELKEMLSSYTSDFPAVRNKQIELDTLKRELKLMAASNKAALPKLTEAYGALVLQRVKLATEMQALSLEYTSNHPTVRLKMVELNLLEHEIVKTLR